MIGRGAVCETTNYAVIPGSNPGLGLSESNLASAIPNVFRMGHLKTNRGPLYLKYLWASKRSRGTLIHPEITGGVSAVCPLTI